MITDFQKFSHLLRKLSIRKLQKMNEKKSDFEKSCLELAQAGEHLCKLGECQKGVEHFQMALHAGTDDLVLLSAIYSQMGNAYFYLQQYDNALEYHKYDLQLSTRLNYKIGEAKAYGNIGNTFKIMGRFEDAVSCCGRHLSISQEIEDRIGEARAFYNLGNIYFSEAKKLISKRNKESDSYPKAAEEALDQAINHYRSNLMIVSDLNDKSAIGRTCGNLGSSFYLRGDFENAVKFHLQRLNIAKEFGDKVAERKSCSNLGNAFVLKGDYRSASDYYGSALDLARELSDRSLEGQISYSLGNVHSLLGDHAKAVEHFLHHLSVAEELSDADELSNAYWSLGNAYFHAGETRKSMEFTKLHLNLSSKMGDVKGQQTALAKLNQLNAERHSKESESAKCFDEDQVDVGYTRRYRSQRSSSHTDGPIGGDLTNKPSTTRPPVTWKQSLPDDDQEQFFERLTEFQSRRMDDQRCSYRGEKRFHSGAAASCLVQNDHDYGTSIGESKAAFGVTGVPPLGDESKSSRKSSVSSKSEGSSTEHERKVVPDESLFNLLINFQSNRYEDQRSPMPFSPDRISREGHQKVTHSAQLDRRNDAAALVLLPDSTTEGDGSSRSIFSGITKLTGSKILSKKRK